MTTVAVPRRAVLAGALGATAGLVLGETAALAAPRPTDWAALDRALTGPLYRPGGSGYAAAKRVFDPLYDSNTPVGVARVRSVADVQACVRFAAKFGLKLAPRSGGHSYIGASAASGSLVVDVRDLSGVSYSSATGRVSVGAGANLYSVHRSLAQHGRSIPTGTCPTVGAAGLTLGGGIGVESREFGLTCDRLVSANLVLPNGTAVVASPSQHSDLLWALRGGGGGAVGVVTSLQFATHGVGNRGRFYLRYAGSRAVAVLVGWARWSASTSRTRWAGVHVNSLANGHISVAIVGVTRAGDERAAANSLVAAIGAAPTSLTTSSGSYMGLISYLGGGSTSPRTGFHAGTDVLASVTSRSAAAVVGVITARSRAGRPGVALLDPLTGAVGDPARGATAFPWRDHAASLQWYSGASSASSHREVAAWVASAHRSLGAYSSGGYLNYLETGQPSASRYLSTNAARWRAIRASADPTRRLSPGIS